MEPVLLAWFGLPGGVEWIIIGLVALLLFGRRLPEVARSLGKSIIEFKKGIKDVKEDIDVEAKVGSSSAGQLEQKPGPADASPPATPQAPSNESVESRSSAGQ